MATSNAPDPLSSSHPAVRSHLEPSITEAASVPARGEGSGPESSPRSSLRLPTELSRRLSRVSLLRGVDMRSVLGILSDCAQRSLAPGEVLIQAHEEDARMFLLLEGSLRVHVDTLENEPVASLEAGESVGELALLDEKPRSAFVVASEPSLVLELDRERFWSLVQSSHEVALNLLGVLAERLRGSNGTLAQSRRVALEYQRHASVDGLTGLYNRRWLDEVLPRQVSRSRIEGKPLSLVMLDVDHFKRFNDEFGHRAGDLVLYGVGRGLRERFRPTDLVARFGGEEFCVMLPGTDLSGAVSAADRVRAAIAETEFELDPARALPRVTLSAGVAELLPGEGLDSLLERADAALYRAKALGRNRVVPARDPDPSLAALTGDLADKH